MKDLTVVYLTANRMPAGWVRYHRNKLLWAVGEYPVITISREPVALGRNLLDDTPISYTNVYRQLLRAAHLAETPYIGMAEDDTLYPPEHFEAYRPAADEVAYNSNRWGLFTWNGWYSRRSNITNAVLIAPREYLIEALEERFAKCSEEQLERWAGEVGRHRLEVGLGVTLRRMVRFSTDNPVVQLSHPRGLEPAAQHSRKSLGQMPTKTLPYWGASENVLVHYV